MSAIAGIIKFDNSEVPQGKKKIIKEVSSIFCTDRTDEIERQGLYFMCGHQHVTREAEKDRSPIINKNEDIVFNADIFLFNRPELIEKLTKEAGLDYRALTEKGDAELAYITYQKYGIDFVNILNGAYAIVIYDKKLSKVFLITYHLAFRHLAYTVTGKELYYSSTYHVISALMEESLELDEEWMSAAYMDFTPDTEKLHGRSPYKNVFRIEPAHYIEISMSKDGTEKNISVEPEGRFTVSLWV